MRTVLHDTDSVFAGEPHISGSASQMLTSLVRVPRSGNLAADDCLVCPVCVSGLWPDSETAASLGISLCKIKDYHRDI